ncbi:MAG: hypothetical protein ACKV0T_14115 [Planctomycetales bacterium]
MTGYTVHTGSTVQFSTGWDNIFGASKGGKPKRTTKAAKKGNAASAAAKKRKKKR